MRWTTQVIMILSASGRESERGKRIFTEALTLEGRGSHAGSFGHYNGD